MRKKNATPCSVGVPRKFLDVTARFKTIEERYSASLPQISNLHSTEWLPVRYFCTYFTSKTASFWLTFQRNNIRAIKRSHTLQISLDLCIPEKELAKTRSQISFMTFCQELLDPKRNYENQIWTKAPKDVIMKNYYGFELRPSASGADS